jgi:drug/metabolite transporter (DMT)-like permease
VTHSRLAVAALLAVAAAWESTFFLTKYLLQRIDVADYLVLRFAIAAVVLLAVHPAAVGRLRRLDRRRGVALGVTYGLDRGGPGHGAGVRLGFRGHARR